MVPGLPNRGLSGRQGKCEAAQVSLLHFGAPDRYVTPTFQQVPLQEQAPMARVTVEDCIDKVENRFDLVLLASHRARMISSGSQITIERDNDKNPVVALREIADDDHLARRPQGGTRPLAAEIRRGRRARARGCSADRRCRRHGRRRRHRGHRRPDDRGRAAQGPGRAHSARGAARGRGITKRRLCRRHGPALSERPRPCWSGPLDSFGNAWT